MVVEKSITIKCVIDLDFFLQKLSTLIVLNLVKMITEI